MSTPISILFVSRRDSLRSVLASACLTHVANAKFHVTSCGVPGSTAPAPHPLALTALTRAGIAPNVAPPRDWSRIAQRLARAPDIVIVLDARVAMDMPTFHGPPDTAIWPLDDLIAEGRETTLEEVTRLLHGLRRRLDIVANLPMRHVDRDLLRSDLRDLGYA